MATLANADAVESSYSIESEVFRKDGCVVLDGLADASLCRSIASKAEALWQGEKLIEVILPTRRGTTRFSAINGEELLAQIPECRVLHDQFLRIATNVTQATLAALNNPAIGISLNVTPSGGRFDYHYDRHLMTVVVYCNAVEGGETIVHPRLRLVLPRQAGLVATAQRYVDAATKTALVRSLAGKRVVAPQRGRAFLFEATRSLHAVQPVRAARPRVSVQFGYDLPGVDFSPDRTTDYYGYRQTPPIAGDQKQSSARTAVSNS